MIPERPSHTAWRVAIRRATHQLLDHPLILDDPIALPILGAETEAVLRADPAAFESGPIAPFLRAFMAVRSRFVEDQLAAARDAGISQYVILGAGLDTLAHRIPAHGTPLRVWEVDHPSTQAWKQHLLRDASISSPPSLTFVSVDFERDLLPESLARAGFDPGAGAVFSWLGVVPYLSRDAIFTTLAYVAKATSTAGGIAFDYTLALHLLSPSQQEAVRAMADKVAAVGEPWQSYFDPDELTRDLRSLGFAAVDDITPERLSTRYIANRTDGLHIGGVAHIMWAGASPCTIHQPPTEESRQ